MGDIELKPRNPQGKYWDDRFRNGGKVWVEAPCAAALEAEVICKNYCVTRILLPGGRAHSHWMWFFVGSKK